MQDAKQPEKGKCVECGKACDEYYCSWWCFGVATGQNT